MDLDKLKELLELIADQDVTEFELEEEGLRLQIKKNTGSALAVSPVAPEPVSLQVSTPQPPQGVVTHSSPASVPSADVSEASLDGLTIVPSPMVGTFYRASEPGAKPFVEKGAQVAKGQVLCIIEAMKLMNEIESELNGELVEVFAENGQPVQYGDRLFAIRER